MLVNSSHINLIKMFVTVFGTSLILFNCILSTLSQSFGKHDCTYEINVWNPDADELQRMRTLEVGFANFTNYVDKELLTMKLHRSNDLATYRNWTVMCERSLADMKTEQLQKYVELQDLRVKIGLYELKLEEMKQSLDDSMFILSTKKANRKNHVRRDRMVPSSQADTPRNHMVENLRNKVTDLKAEWILLKREFIDMRSDNKELHKVQDILNKSYTELKQSNGELHGLFRQLKSNDIDTASDIENMKANMEHLYQDLSTIKAAQQSLKNDMMSTSNGLSSVQAATVNMRRTLVDLREHSGGGQRVSNVDVGLDEASDHEDTMTERVVMEKETIQIKSSNVPTDCSGVRKMGHTLNGLYKVKPGPNLPMDYVYCEFIDDIGYTLIQRRVDGLQGFDRGWLEYKIGFGNMYGSFWVGNEFVHTLTKDNAFGLRIDIWDWEGNITFAEYDVFSIGDESNRYVLHVSGYEGDAGDSLTYHDGMKFSTVDHDNDLSDRNCAADNNGGWWYSGCYYSNLNGAYHVGWYSHSQSTFADGIVWYSLKDSDRYSIRKVEMKLRRHV